MWTWPFTGLVVSDHLVKVLPESFSAVQLLLWGGFLKVGIIVEGLCETQYYMSPSSDLRVFGFHLASC